MKAEIRNERCIGGAKRVDFLAVSGILISEGMIPPVSRFSQH